MVKEGMVMMKGEETLAEMAEQVEFKRYNINRNFFQLSRPRLRRRV